MSRRKKLFIGGLLAAVIVLTVSVGGVVYAQTTDTGATTAKTFAARVAAILGIEQTKVEAAFTQARKEMQAEALDARLRAAVEQGKLTQAQADELKSWWQARPDVPLGPALKRHGFRGFRAP